MVRILERKSYFPDIVLLNELEIVREQPTFKLSNLRIKKGSRNKECPTDAVVI